MSRARQNRQILSDRIAYRCIMIIALIRNLKKIHGEPARGRLSFALMLGAAETKPKAASCPTQIWMDRACKLRPKPPSSSSSRAHYLLQQRRRRLLHPATAHHPIPMPPPPTSSSTAKSEFGNLSEGATGSSGSINIVSAFGS